jgi:hypothetical protein
MRCCLSKAPKSQQRWRLCVQAAYVWSDFSWLFRTVAFYARLFLSLVQSCAAASGQRHCASDSAVFALGQFRRFRDALTMSDMPMKRTSTGAGTMSVNCQ